MKNIVGPPVRRGDFLERKKDREQFVHCIERGHVLMLAARRVGKTSFLLSLVEDFPHGWKCLYFSVESLESEEEFVSLLLLEIYRLFPRGAWLGRLGGELRSLFQGMEVDAGFLRVNLPKAAQAIGGSWREAGARAVEALRDVSENLLVIVDEFPFFIRNLMTSQEPAGGKRRAELFLHWFRAVRNVERSRKGKVHFALTGSMGLDSLVKDANLTGSINDVRMFPLGPLSREMAEELLDRLGKGENLPLSTEVKDRILQYIDWHIPYHLQLLFGEVLRQANGSGAELSERAVDEAYGTLLSPENRLYFNHWVERLDEQPLVRAGEVILKKRLLDAAAKDRRGISWNTALQIRKKVAPDLDEKPVLGALHNDGYLLLKEDRWRFASSLLRDWWSTWQARKRAA